MRNIYEICTAGRFSTTSLEIATQSLWSEHLVLTGSLMMPYWFGDKAREPNDIDWVVRPATINSEESMSQKCFADLIRRVKEKPTVGNMTIHTENLAPTDIGDYGEQPGKRLFFWWQIGSYMSGIVQMDFVFGEELHTEPIAVSYPVSQGGTLPLWTASPEEMLLWKLYWLEHDQSSVGYVRDKDLFDAALLAENTPISDRLLTRILDLSQKNPDFAMNWKTTWNINQLMKEQQAIDTEIGKARLTRALAPVFGQRNLESTTRSSNVVRQAKNKRL